MDATLPKNKHVNDPEAGICLTAEEQSLDGWWCLTITLTCGHCGRFHHSNTKQILYSMN